MQGPNGLDESPIAIEGDTRPKSLAAAMIQEQIEVFRASAKPKPDFDNRNRGQYG